MSPRHDFEAHSLTPYTSTYNRVQKFFLLTVFDFIKSLEHESKPIINTSFKPFINLQGLLLSVCEVWQIALDTRILISENDSLHELKVEVVQSN